MFISGRPAPSQGKRAFSSNALSFLQEEKGTEPEALKPSAATDTPRGEGGLPCTACKERSVPTPRPKAALHALLQPPRQRSGHSTVTQSSTKQTLLSAPQMGMLTLAKKTPPGGRNTAFPPPPLFFFCNYKFKLNAKTAECHESDRPLKQKLNRTNIAPAELGPSDVTGGGGGRG